MHHSSSNINKRSASSAPPDFLAMSRQAPVGITHLPQKNFVVLFNTGAGSDTKDETKQQITNAIKAAGGTATFVELTPSNKVADIIERAALQAKVSGTVLVAAGGDGTVNSVAAQCCKHHIPMGIIPMGTFNYFARELGIPLEPAAAAKVLTSGRLHAANVGYVNDKLFLVNASFGLYTRIIHRREEDKSRFGRFRIVALLSALATLLQGQRPFAIRIVGPDGVQLRRTAMVFVGNNRFQLNNLDLDIATCSRHQQLGVLIMKPMRRFDTARLIWRGLLRSLNEHDRLEMFCAKLFSVDTKLRMLDLVIDGEVTSCRTPLAFRLAPGALQVLAPEDAAS